MRSIDNTSLAALFAIYSGSNFIHLVQFSHPNLSTPLYYCDDNQNVTSNGITYQWTNMRVAIPVDDTTRAPTGSLEIENTLLDMTAMINQCNGGVNGQAIVCSVAIINRAEPNTLIVPFIAMEMRQPKTDAKWLSCTLEQEEALDETVPGDTMTPYVTPGIFTASWYQQPTGGP